MRGVKMINRVPVLLFQLNNLVISMENLKLRGMKRMTLINLELHSNESNFYVVLFYEIWLFNGIAAVAVAAALAAPFRHPHN